MPTHTITRSLREENTAQISGAEAPVVEGSQFLEQEISPGEEEVTGLAAFWAHVLQDIVLKCDQDVIAMFLGQRFAVLATVAGPPGTITHTGDLEQEIFPGDLVRLEGTVGDDGVYLVVTVVEVAGTTTITLENGQALPAGGGGAVGTVARVASQQRIGYAYPILATTALGVITYTGNVSDKFAAGDWLTIMGTVGNDGLWEIDTVVFAAGVTTITVNGGVLPGAEGAVGAFTKVRAGIALTANTPFLWSVESGIQNPFIHPDTLPGVAPLFNAFRGRVGFCLVDNAGATAGNFLTRLGTNAVL